MQTILSGLSNDWSILNLATPDLYRIKTCPFMTLSWWLILHTRNRTTQFTLFLDLRFRQVFTEGSPHPRVVHSSCIYKTSGGYSRTRRGLFKGWECLYRWGSSKHHCQPLWEGSEHHRTYFSPLANHSSVLHDDVAQWMQNFRYDGNVNARALSNNVKITLASQLKWRQKIKKEELLSFNPPNAYIESKSNEFCIHFP